MGPRTDGLDAAIRGLGVPLRFDIFADVDVDIFSLRPFPRNGRGCVVLATLGRRGSTVRSCGRRSLRFSLGLRGHG